MTPEKAKSDAALADILARYIAIAQDPEYQARRQAEAEVKQLSKRR